MLTTAEIDQYRRDGYVIPAAFRLPPTELAPGRPILADPALGDLHRKAGAG